MCQFGIRDLTFVLTSFVFLATSPRQFSNLVQYLPTLACRGVIARRIPIASLLPRLVHSEKYCFVEEMAFHALDQDQMRKTATADRHREDKAAIFKWWSFRLNDQLLQRVVYNRTVMPKFSVMSCFLTFHRSIPT